MALLARLGITLPIIQAPMAGVVTPKLAAAVSNAGALGSIALGATDAAGARKLIEETQALTDKPFNVNLFVHTDATANEAKEAAWLDELSARDAVALMSVAAEVNLHPELMANAGNLMGRFQKIMPGKKATKDTSTPSSSETDGV